MMVRGVTMQLPTTVNSGAKAPLPATFILNSFLSKLAPLTTYNGFRRGIERQNRIRYVICQGGKLDKKEFKRNAGESVCPAIYGLVDFGLPTLRVIGNIMWSGIQTQFPDGIFFKRYMPL
jgi:hypothetical protein